MTKISAKILADSKNMGFRLTTFVVTFPRFILAEFNTHRMFSRNSASSRAIPFEKMVKSVEENPFIPIGWQKHHKGMQGNEYLNPNADEGLVIRKWLSARDSAVEQAKQLYSLGVTKQLCNRILEPFMWHTVIVTATDWENFFVLRCPEYKTKFGTFRSIKDAREAEVDITGKNPNTEILETPFEDDVLDCLAINKGQAEIHIMVLAEVMWNAYNESTPKQLQAGDWHIPFNDFNIDEIKELAKNYHHQGFAKSLEEELMIKIATARCARISYTVVGEEGKKPNLKADIELHDKLAVSGHFSPFEHMGRAMTGDEINQYSLWLPEHIEYGISGNLRGFIQYRKMLPNENKV